VDIAALSIMSSQNNVQNQASILMMRKILDTTQQNGQATIDLLASASPKLSPDHLGHSIDILA
jgi:hypothetical protein